MCNGHIKMNANKFSVIAAHLQLFKLLLQTYVRVLYVDLHSSNSLTKTVRNLYKDGKFNI